LKRPVGLSEIHLGLLDWQDVSRFVEAALGEVPDRELVDRLARETGGNPLFLLESLQQQTAGSPQDGANPRSAGIKTLMHERLERIGAADRRVLMAAVVLADKIRMDLLEEVSLLSAEQVVQALENLEAVNLLRPVKHDRWHYSFVHDKLREILYQDLSPARRQLLHTRAARALEGQAKPVVSREAALLAAHFEAAGDLKKAFHYWLQAGQYAHHLFSRLEAHQAYQRAEHCLAQLGSHLSDADVYRLYSGWSRLAIDLGDVQVLGYLSFEQNRIAGKRVSALLSGSALSSRGMMQILKNELEEAAQTIQASIHYLEQTDYQYEIIEAYNRLGQAFKHLNRLSEAGAALQHGLELGEQAQESAPLEALINIQCQYSNLMCYMGDPNQALELANQAMKNSERIHYSAGLVRAQLRKVWALYHLCRLQEGIALGNSVLPLAHSMGNLRIAASLHMVVARCALLSGQLKPGWENNEQALQLGEENHYPEILSEGLCIRGDAYRMMGDFMTAEDCYRAGIDKDGHALQILINRYRLGFCLAWTGRADEGLQLVEQSIQEARAASIQTVNIPAEVLLANYYANHHQMCAAQQHCENAERALSTFTAPALDNAVHLLQSIIASDDAQPPVNAAGIQSVYENSIQLGDVWVALLSLSHLYMQHQHSEEGAGYRQQMLTLFSQIEQTGIPEPLLLSYQRFKQGFLEI
jgi:tetratricopeptide (TPR) repeat protein